MSTHNFFNLTPKTRQAIISEMNYLAQFIDKELKDYCLPEWTLWEAQKEIYKITLTGTKLIEGDRKKICFIFPSLEKVRQINTVIKNGMHDKKDITRKLIRDYSK